MAFSLHDYGDIRELRRGGMARVLLAEQKSLGRLVVIKEFKLEPGADPSLVKRFETEARAAAALDHENVIRVFDFGPHGNAFYLSMEYVDGPNLEELMVRFGADSTVSLAAALFAFKGLRYTHERGIIHRDVKPANILISKTGSVKIADFGLAYAEDIARGITTSGVMLGTPRYMAPEQINGIKQPDARMDVWAAGILLYRLISGSFPFEGATVTALIYSVLETEPQDIGTPAPGTPKELAAVVMRCIAKDPLQRPATLDPVIRALTNYLHSLGIQDPGEHLSSYLRSRGNALHPASTAKADDGNKGHGPTKTVIENVKQAGTGPRRGPVVLVASLALAALAVFVVVFVSRRYQSAPSAPAGKSAPILEQANTHMPREAAPAATDTNGNGRRPVEAVRVLRKDVARPPATRAAARPASAPASVKPAAAAALPAVGDAVVLTRGGQAPGEQPASVAKNSPGPFEQNQATGEFRALSYPDADIFIDGKPMGKTLSSGRLRVAAGRHILLLRRGGYADYTKEIEIKSGDYTEIKVRMTKY